MGRGPELRVTDDEDMLRERTRALELDARFRRLLRLAQEVLEAAGCGYEARRLAQAPIRPQNRYACAVRTLFAVESALRAQHATAPRHQISAAIEAVAIARLGLDTYATAVGLGRDPALAWMETLAGRQQALLGVVRGEYRAGAQVPGR